MISGVSAKRLRNPLRALRLRTRCSSFSHLARCVPYSAKACFRSPGVFTATNAASSPWSAATSPYLAFELTPLDASIALKACAAALRS